MSRKRMFDRAIIETDNFLNVSLSAKGLYFLLGMEADDEGFVSPNRVLRLYGGEVGDIKNLVDVGLIIPFKSGVVVITDWNENNYLDKNRIKQTRYQDEKGMLTLTEHKRYVLNKCSTSIEERSIEENRIEESRKSLSLTSKETALSVKETFGELETVSLKTSEYEKLVEKYGNEVTNKYITDLDLYLASLPKGKKKYASHYAVIKKWLSRDKAKQETTPRNFREKPMGIIL